MTSVPATLLVAGAATACALAQPLAPPPAADTALTTAGLQALVRVELPFGPHVRTRIGFCPRPPAAARLAMPDAALGRWQQVQT